MKIHPAIFLIVALVGMVGLIAWVTPARNQAAPKQAAMSREIEFEPAKLGQSAALWQLAEGEDILRVRRGETVQLHVRATMKTGHFIFTHEDGKFMPQGPVFKLSSGEVARLEDPTSIFPVPQGDPE